MKLPGHPYFAGFFDGEGCISIGKQESSYYSLHCSVGNTDISVLYLLKEKYGGKVWHAVRRNERHKPSYVWGLMANNAEDFLRKIYPYLIIKRERAEKAFFFRSLFKGKFRAKSKRTDKEVKKHQETVRLRSECYKEMKRLNYRGVDLELKTKHLATIQLDNSSQPLAGIPDISNRGK